MTIPFIVLVLFDTILLLDVVGADVFVVHLLSSVDWAGLVGRIPLLLFVLLMEETTEEVVRPEMEL